MDKKHTSFTVSESGLVIHPCYSHLGASPDGVIMCACCGSGVLEIKCPFSCKSNSLLEVSREDKNFCLELQDGSLKRKDRHTYYYQIQLQMKVCEVGYCDFVVWCPTDIHIERITANKML